MSAPRVSVIVACYNQEHLVGETLDSVLAQDFQDFEIVISDDGSTDGTQRVLREYAARHPGKVVPVLNPKNQGITANSNAALSAARGELIATLAGDDLFMPGKLRAQVAEFDRDPQVMLCYHPVEIFDSETGKTLYVTNQKASEDSHSAEDIILRSGIPGSASVMVRRSALPAGGYDPRLRAVSDWLFFIEAALKGKVVKVDQVLGRYRKHGQGITARVGDLLEETLYALDLAIEKHPEVDWLPAVARRGKARYLAGEAFRRMDGEPAKAREYARQAVEFDPSNWRYRALAALTRFRVVSAVLGPVLNRGKYLVKRLAT